MEHFIWGASTNNTNMRQRRIQDSNKNLRWSLFQQNITACSKVFYFRFLQKSLTRLWWTWNLTSVSRSATYVQIFTLFFIKSRDCCFFLLQSPWFCLGLSLFYSQWPIFFIRFTVVFAKVTVLWLLKLGATSEFA